MGREIEYILKRLIGLDHQFTNKMVGVLSDLKSRGQSILKVKK